MSPRSSERRRRDEGGSAGMELVLVTPVLVMFLVFVVGLGVMAQARQEVEAVASDAARAASLERNTFLSQSAARTAAQRSLADAGLECAGLQVVVDISEYHPGGQVTATVTCTAQVSDMTMLGVPGTRTFRSTSTVPIETYRGS